MKRLLVLVGVVVPFMVLGGCGSDSSTAGSGGKVGTDGGSSGGVTGSGGSSTGGMPGSGGRATGGAASGGSSTGGTTDGGTVDMAPGDAPTTDAPGDGAGTGGAVDAGAGGAAGSAGFPQGGAGVGGGIGGGATGGAPNPTLAQLCGAAGGAGGSAASAFSFVNQTYVNDSRLASSEAVFSFINTIDDPHTQILRLHNGGTSSIQVTSLQLVGNTIAPGTNAPATPGAAGGTLFPLTYNQVSLPSAFQITPNVAVPTTLGAGADLDVTVQFLSTKTNPPDRMLNIGGQSVSAVLVAQIAGGCVPAGLYGVALWNNSETAPDPTTMPPTLPSANWARYEPTFGQIVATLGYKVNLGSVFIQLLNTNDMSIPSTGLSTEEVQTHKFVKADAAAPVQLFAVGRFAPPTDIPYGWYTVGSLTGTAVGAGGAGGTGGAPPIVTDAQPAAIPSTSTQLATQPAPLKVIATMLSGPLGVDWNTSNYSELVLPPLKTGSASTTFEPGSAIFGIWSFTNQRTTGGLSSAGVAAPNVGNGDYIYSEDALNIDTAHSHRLRVYPLKNRAGVLVPNGYLLGWEEASNGDYQDFIFVLKNVAPAP